MKIIVLIFVMFLSSINFVDAATTSRTFIKKGCNIRLGPGTNHNKIANAKSGFVYNLVDDKLYEDTNNKKGCENGWYQVYFNGTATGYVCSDFVDIVKSHSTDDIEPATDCEKEFSAKGFPSSYWGGLCDTKKRHPNWEFSPKITNLKWKDVIEAESPCGWNLIYNSDANKGFIDTTCQAYDSGYVGILPKGVAYYMDPRNFLAETTMFQFYSLKYDKQFENQYLDGSKSILNRALFYKYHEGLGTNLSDIINQAGLELGVSPIFTSSRILQELGYQDSLYNLYSGVYEGLNREYYGYYNFYNFGVSDGCVQEHGTTYCGLSYAKREIKKDDGTIIKYKWDSVSNAIKGGIDQLSRYYIGNNQYTSYYQKFNVIGPRPFTHQYQTNIIAPSSESTITYNTYKDLGILDSKLSFEIPVYLEMNASIDNSNSGAIEEEDKPVEPSTMPISTIVTSSGYRYTSKYISKINPGTTVNEVKTNIESVGGNSTVLITDRNNKEVNDGLIGTGFKVSINNKSTTEVLEVVINGDTSGDGIINALDLLQIQKNILGTFSLTNSSMEAGDTSGDNVINALDLLQVQKNILGTFKIE